jgi:uncharacterized protein with ATP-grasp and redox domains
MGQRFHRTIRAVLNDPDPYREIKKRFTRLAVSLYPAVEHRVRSAVDPLATSIRLSIAGNIIDFGPDSDLTESDVERSIEEALIRSLDGDVEQFRAAVAGAARILFLADNAGEIVFDRLLINQLPRDKVTVVVRGSPTINDATLEDARAAGIDQVVEVIDNGSDVPGTILAETSAAFRSRFDDSDLVIAKGQGNYESLSDSKKNIFFLLKAKCEVIARDMGCAVGTMVLRRSIRQVQHR